MIETKKDFNVIASSFSKFKSIFNLKKRIAERQESILNITALSGAAKSFLIAEAAKLESHIIVLLPDVQSVLELSVELNLLALADKLIIITEFKSESLQEQLTDISSREKLIVVSTYALLNCLLPAKKEIENNTTKIQVGGDLTYNDLLEYLNLLNYQREKFVESPGEYSQRGSIIDFWSYSEKNAVRLEFDGDFLESIRLFDPESQRSIEMVKSVTIAGNLGETENKTEKKLTDIFEYIKKPLVFASSYELENFISEIINFYEEPKPIQQTIVEEEISENIDIISSDGKKIDFERGFIDDGEDAIQTAPPEVENKTKFSVAGIDARWIIEEELGNSENKINLGITDPPTVNSNYEALMNVIDDYTKQNYKVVVTSENDLQTNRLKELLSNLREEINYLTSEGLLVFETFGLYKGFISKEEKFLLLTDYQIFNKPYRTKINSKNKKKKSKAKEFASINKGDFVVHEDFGIGKYMGLENIRIGEVDQESMKILYNDGGIVYVNLNYLSLVKKFSSKENAIPKLSTLGNGEWETAKQKTKKRIKEAARELITLYARRKATPGYRFSPDTIWQKELENSFFYEDTPDQAKVTEELKHDMESGSPMDRLVCGDVGFGKTEIAVRAAFKAVQDGKQAAVLVPTTILAEQHYNTFSDRLSQYPVKVAALSRFQSKKEQVEIIKELKEGKIDIVIGTHRLISKDIEFRDLGILIIDEEHRFGVMAKEKLRSIKANVDTLTLTATPIPRTLNLSLVGARDLSLIATPPPNRQPIYTQVAVFDILKVREWIMQEINRKGQIYLIHDRVQSISKLADYIKKYIPEVKIGVAHGQMKPSQLEEVIHGFLNKKYDILICTKIVESGIDIPNVNTIIINRADRFGLAELHQLRGRVGRSNRQAYAYFLVPSLSGITKKSLRRLQAIEEFTDVGSGFNLAMRDLEIRGAGNLLGTSQSGFIDLVGFEMYLKLINEAVEELKYQEFKEVFENLPKQEVRTEPTIDTFFEIGIPEAFMPDQMDRLNFYTTLYSIKNIDELEEIKDEIIDRFGVLPILVKRLISTAMLKFYASYALYERIIMQRKKIIFILPRGKKEEYYQIKFPALMKFILDNYKTSVKFEQQDEIMKLVMPNNFASAEQLLEYAVKFCKETANLFTQNSFK
jgi:transcription-repair coupling factor (superfamily II helicase)